MSYVMDNQVRVCLVTQRSRPVMVVSSDPNKAKLCDRRITDGPYFFLPSSRPTNGEVEKVTFYIFLQSRYQVYGFRG